MKEKAFQKKEVIKIAKRLQNKSMCDNCIGRQFAQISTNLTNNKRGKILRKLLKVKKESLECDICDTLFKNLDRYAKKTIQKSKGIEFKTFVVGTKMSPKIIRKEEALWEEIGIKYCEPIKSEINRELGKLLEKTTKKLVDEKQPDIVFLLNLVTHGIEIEIKPLFIKGYYKKLVRGIPQTKWDKYKLTVEDIIAGPIMKDTGGKEHSLHCMGREDIDARCLDWRPFVFEISIPRKRAIDLKKITEKINNGRKVEVSKLGFTNRKEIVAIKNMKADKTYRVLVSLERPPKNIESLKKLIGYINQETPKRVLHRRANKLRKRRVKSIKWKNLDNKRIELIIKGEAGIYIKELVTGDEGRTRPSISEILNNKAKVEELDVIKIHL